MVIWLVSYIKFMGLILKGAVQRFSIFIQLSHPKLEYVIILLLVKYVDRLVPPSQYS